MRFSIIVPTYRRGDALSRCLVSLQEQTCAAEQIIVVMRAQDMESEQVVSKSNDPRMFRVLVDIPGVVAAMNAGLEIARGEIIALTDDDAAPWPDWLARIEKHFAADSQLGAVGGRDWQYKGEPLSLDDGCETRAGDMQWWGRVIGQHHWAAPGPARQVSVIKGVNCAFRAEALRQVGGFDTRLAGTGAQVHWELSVCLALRRAGWKIVFDPSIGVDHFPAVRFDEDQRASYVPLAQQNAVANETMVLFEHFGYIRRGVFLAWAMIVGTRGSPGVFQLFRLLAMRQPHAGRRFLSTWRGRFQGLRMYQQSTRSRTE